VSPKLKILFLFIVYYYLSFIHLVTLSQDLCKAKTDARSWQLCPNEEDEETNKERDLDSYGPARRIAEKPFVIVVCKYL